MSDAVRAFLRVNRRKVIVPVMGRDCMTIDVGMDAARRVMIIVIVAQMRVDERRRECPRLKCDRKSEGKKSPAHGLILLEGLVLDRAVGMEFV
jgi:hypothetical protein